MEVDLNMYQYDLVKIWTKKRTCQEKSMTYLYPFHVTGKNMYKDLWFPVFNIQDFKWTMNNVLV